MNNDQYLATTLFGLEELLADELNTLGARSVHISNRAVGFQGDRAMFYRANYHLRLALRVLRHLASFSVRREDEIYRSVRSIPWERYLDGRNTLVVDTVLVTERFRNAVYISQLVKDAIVDRLRDRTGIRPSVDLKDPDLRIRVHLNEKECNISLDGSGESLHKRGYRVRPHIAPLNEVLAAGMVLMSGWEPSKPFINPMCGSGTLCIEAGMISKGLPGGYFRSGFGFQRWRDYDQDLFETIRREHFLEAGAGFNIIACDNASPAIRASQHNFASAGMLGEIRIEKSSFEDLKPGTSDGWLMINPPYGERMEEENLHSMYAAMGTTLKHKYGGHEAWILSGNPGAMKHVGLRPGKRAELFNGPIRCKFHQYDLYEGSRKAKRTT